MDRIIDVKVNGDYLSMDRRKAGNQHEANITRLRIHFDPNWDGLAKTVTFWDANGNHPVKRTLTADRLEDAAKDIRVYLCPIPGEALAESGVMTFTIDGYRDGVRQRTAGAELEVGRSPYEENAGEPADPTPSQAEQLQVQIDTMLGEMQEMSNRAVAAAAAAESARDASLEIVGGDYVTREELNGKSDAGHTHTLASIGAAAADGLGTVPDGTDLSTLGGRNGWYLLSAFYTYINHPANGAWAILTIKDKTANIQIINGKLYYTGNVLVSPTVWCEVYSSENKPTLADLGAVAKGGDVMTGSLSVSMGGGNAVLDAGAECAYLQTFKDGDWARRRMLLLRNMDYSLNLESAVTIGALDDGMWKEYALIHQKNLHLIDPVAIGSARIEKGSYVGTGKAGSLHPNSLTFGFEPFVVMIGGYGVANGVVYFKGMTSMSVYANTFTQYVNFALNGNTLTWYNSSAGESDEATTYTMGQMNKIGETYNYVAFG